MTMLSRVAENIYWMARYVERAENTARLINVHSYLLLDLPKRVRLGWAPIIDILGSREAFDKLGSTEDEKVVLRFIISGANNPDSILSALKQARETARTIRDIIPREAWEQVNDLYIMTKNEAQSGLSSRKRYDYLRNIILRAQTVTGLLAGTMTHDEGYDFLRLGRNLERGDMTTRIIDVRSASLLPDTTEDLTPYENIQWMGVLKSLTGYQMYRRAVQVRVNRTDVLTFLLKDRCFPRSFYHTVREVENCLAYLPRHEGVKSEVEKVKKVVLNAKPAALQQAELHEFIDKLQLGLANVHTSIDETYFRYLRK